jgi:hypothetical protein
LSLLSPYAPPPPPATNNISTDVIIPATTVNVNEACVTSPHLSTPVMVYVVVDSRLVGVPETVPVLMFNDIPDGKLGLIE